MADQQPQAQYKAFISYSRKNKEFVKKLNDGLDSNGAPAWVDWEGIPLSSTWRAEIKQAIISTDVFVFVISPESCASEECGKEVEIALAYKKKLVPVLHRMPEKDGPQPHQKIREINWIYMRDGEDDFAATLPKMIEAIKTDLEWVHQNSRLLERAVEWENKNKDASTLLRGKELDEAERWRIQAASETNREIAPIQNEYIDESRKAMARGQRLVFVSVLIALAISVGLAVVAVAQSIRASQSEQAALHNEKIAIAAQATAQFNEALAKTKADEAKRNAAIAVAAEDAARANEKLALENENSAKAQRSAALAQILQRRPGELDISTLLAIDSMQRLPSFQAEEILRQNIGRSPHPVGQALLGGHVGRLAFSPDGNVFVSSAWNGEACIWQATNMEQLRCLNHNEWVVDAFFIDNQRLVTASGKTVFVWNIDTGGQVFTYEAPATITAIAVSPDGIWLAVGTVNNINNEELLIVNLVTKKFVESSEQLGDVIKLEFSSDNKRLAIGTSAGKVNIWLMQTEILTSALSHRNAIIDLALSPDGKLLVAGGKDSLARAVDTANGTPRYTKNLGDWLEDIEFSPNESFFVTASDDFFIYIWDTLSGSELVRMQHQSFATKVTVSPNNQWVASTSYDRTARVWNVATGDLMLEIPLETFGSALAFSPDGDYLAVGEDGGRVTVWNLQALAMRAGYLEFSDLVHEAHFSADGQWLVVNTDDQKVWMLPATAWQTSTSGIKNGRAIITADDLTTQLVLSPDSRWAATNTNGKIYLYDFTKSKAKILDGAADDRSAFVFSPDGHSLAVSTGAAVIFWDLATAQQTGAFATEEELPINALAFNVDGSQLALGLENIIVVWDIATQSRAAQLEQPGLIHAMTFSHDGKWLATASDNGTTIFWRVQNGIFKETYTFTQDGQANMLQFNPDDTLLAIAGEEGATYLVQVSSGTEYARIQNSVAVTSVSFSKDGKYLSTVSRKVVQVWDLNHLEIIPKELITEIACSRLLGNLDETQWATIFSDDPYHLICPDLPVNGQQ